MPKILKVMVIVVACIAGLWLASEKYYEVRFQQLMNQAQDQSNQQFKEYVDSVEKRRAEEKSAERY